MGAIARFEHAFLALRDHRPLSRSLAFTESGLVLGAATLVAPMRRGGDAADLDLPGEDRILALLAATFSAPVNAAVLTKLRHASELWAQGDKCLAQIHLEHLHLPKVETEEQAFRLFLTDNLIASGQSPRDLCKAMGFDLPEGLRNFSPDQPRDDNGCWTSGGGGANGDIVLVSTIGEKKEKREDDPLYEERRALNARRRPKARATNRSTGVDAFSVFQSASGCRSVIDTIRFRRTGFWKTGRGSREAGA